MRDTARIAHVELSWIAPQDRSYPKDCVLVREDGEVGFVCTVADLADFVGDLDEFFTFCLDQQRREED